MMASEASIELEHAIGCAAIPHTAHLLPHTRKYVYVSGTCVVFSDLDDPHNQSFFRGHDDDVTVLTVSKSGRYVISGQKGFNSDVCVWDCEQQRVLFRIEEHDGGVNAMSITDDERMLLTVGSVTGDHRVTMWDMSVGMIVSTMTMTVNDQITAAVWGGRVKDVKRRDTETYQFALIANTQLLCYHLNPMMGTVQALPLSRNNATCAGTRTYTCIEYSNEGDILFAGSASGDISVIITAQSLIAQATRVCSGGVYCIRCAKPSSTSTSKAVPESSTEQPFQYARLASHNKPVCLYAGGGDGSIIFYCIKDMQCPVLTERNRTHLNGSIISISTQHSASSNENLENCSGLMLAATSLGYIYQISLPMLSATKVLEAPLAPITCACVHPLQNDRVITASAEAILRVWNTSTYEILAKAGGAGVEDATKGSSLKPQHLNSKVGVANDTRQSKGQTTPSSSLMTSPFAVESTASMNPAASTENMTAAAAMRQTSGGLGVVGKAYGYNLSLFGSGRGCIPVCLSYIGTLDVMLTGWSDGAVRTFDATNGELLWSIDRAHRNGITCILACRGQELHQLTFFYHRRPGGRNPRVGLENQGVALRAQGAQVRSHRAEVICGLVVLAVMLPRPQRAWLGLEKAAPRIYP